MTSFSSSHWSPTNPRHVISYIVQCSTKHFVSTQIVLVYSHGCASTEPVLLGWFTDVGACVPPAYIGHVSVLVHILNSWLSTKLSTSRKGPSNEKIGLISTKAATFLDYSIASKKQWGPSPLERFRPNFYQRPSRLLGWTLGVLREAQGNPSSTCPSPSLRRLKYTALNHKILSPGHSAGCLGKAQSQKIRAWGNPFH